jgi:hypothetical protein
MYVKASRMLWGPSPAAFFQFDKEENSEKVLRKKNGGLISGTISVITLRRFR